MSNRLVSSIAPPPPGYEEEEEAEEEDVLGASVAATAVNNPDKLPSSNCTKYPRDFISDKALVMKGCEGGRVLLQGPATEKRRKRANLSSDWCDFSLPS